MFSAYWKYSIISAGLTTDEKKGCLNGRIRIILNPSVDETTETSITEMGYEILSARIAAEMQR